MSIWEKLEKVLSPEQDLEEVTSLPDTQIRREKARTESNPAEKMQQQMAMFYSPSYLLFRQVADGEAVQAGLDVINIFRDAWKK